MIGYKIRNKANNLVFMIRIYSKLDPLIEVFDKFELDWNRCQVYLKQR